MDRVSVCRTLSPLLCLSNVGLSSILRITLFKTDSCVALIFRLRNVKLEVSAVQHMI